MGLLRHTRVRGTAVHLQLQRRPGLQGPAPHAASAGGRAQLRRGGGAGRPARDDGLPPGHGGPQDHTKKGEGAACGTGSGVRRDGDEVQRDRPGEEPGQDQGLRADRLPGLLRRSQGGASAPRGRERQRRQDHGRGRDRRRRRRIVRRRPGIPLDKPPGLHGEALGRVVPLGPRRQAPLGERHRGASLHGLRLAAPDGRPVRLAEGR
mmetsp:Transcript_20327/g.47743  ORF Transcript_20327/g.47743 Transcript_20327/m.47743 type:complete len:207 (+) Transcript_20327:385-1005(+)